MTVSLLQQLDKPPRLEDLGGLSFFVVIELVVDHVDYKSHDNEDKADKRYGIHGKLQKQLE